MTVGQSLAPMAISHMASPGLELILHVIVGYGGAHEQGQSQCHVHDYFQHVAPL